jgi:hypothetical protein
LPGSNSHSKQKNRSESEIIATRPKSTAKIQRFLPNLYFCCGSLLLFTVVVHWCCSLVLFTVVVHCCCSLLLFTVVSLLFHCCCSLLLFIVGVHGCFTVVVHCCCSLLLFTVFGEVFLLKLTRFRQNRHQPAVPVVEFSMNRERPSSNKSSNIDWSSRFCSFTNEHTDAF